MIGCIHYDNEIFQSSLEGLGLANGAAGEEIKEVFSSLISPATSG
jgi:CO dehydrogenase nickel-insertion accessory protein CooC1